MVEARNETNRFTEYHEGTETILFLGNSGNLSDTLQKVIEAQISEYSVAKGGIHRPTTVGELKEMVEGFSAEGKSKITLFLIGHGSPEEPLNFDSEGDIYDVIFKNFQDETKNMRVHDRKGTIEYYTIACHSSYYNDSLQGCVSFKGRLFARQARLASGSADLIDLMKDSRKITRSFERVQTFLKKQQISLTGDEIPRLAKWADHIAWAILQNNYELSSTIIVTSEHGIVGLDGKINSNKLLNPNDTPEEDAVVSLALRPGILDVAKTLADIDLEVFDQIKELFDPEDSFEVVFLNADDEKSAKVFYDRVMKILNREQRQKIASILSFAFTSSPTTTTAIPANLTKKSIEEANYYRSRDPVEAVIFLLNSHDYQVVAENGGFFSEKEVSGYQLIRHSPNAFFSFTDPVFQLVESRTENSNLPNLQNLESDEWKYYPFSRAILARHFFYLKFFHNKAMSIEEKKDARIRLLCLSDPGCGYSDILYAQLLGNLCHRIGWAATGSLPSTTFSIPTPDQREVAILILRRIKLDSMECESLKKELNTQTPNNMTDFERLDTYKLPETSVSEIS